jgi:Flp pilus assembly protein TadG
MMKTRRLVSSGQAVAEFALTVTVFLLLIMAIVDFGRAIYVYNGVSQAAREIARTTSVHSGIPAALGSSLGTADTIAVQRGLVPGLGTPTFECVTDAGTPSSNNPCKSAVDYVRVTVDAPWAPITPILAFLGSFNLSSTSSMRLS